MQLYNSLSNNERVKLIQEAGKDRLTISFYKYFKISDPETFRNKLFLFWDSIDVLGRIYVAHEGINAQLSVPADHFETFKSHLDSINFLKNIRLNVAIVDMRNHYESEIGHFKNAVTPDVDTFRESLDLIEEDLKSHKKTKKLVMYCTGGIRCEKASAYFKHKGFKNVYQLEGGIINYARQVTSKEVENKFIGKNFVFDQRRAEKISDDIIASCHQCGQPADIHVNCANDACHLLFIQCDSCKKSMKNCCSSTCMEVNQLPAQTQKSLRKGQGNSNDIFKKGRAGHLHYSKNLRNIHDSQPEI